MFAPPTAIYTTGLGLRMFNVDRFYCMLTVTVIILMKEIYMCVKGVDFAFFYDFSIWVWNCSDNLVFHFIIWE